MFRFLPTILKQLLYLLIAEGANDNIQIIVLENLVNIVATCSSMGYQKLLKQYIKVCILDIKTLSDIVH